MSWVLAHNTETTAPGVPVIINHPDTFPFAPGERERDWHEASDEEYAAYEEYWDELDRRENPEAYA